MGNGEYTEATMVPTWVVCENTFKLWTVGEKPAPEASLSPQAVAEVARLKAWAAQIVEEDEPCSAPAAAPPKPSPPPSSTPPPPQICVEAVRPTHVPAPSAPVCLRQFDPAVLAQVAAIKARASPLSVVSNI